MKLRRSYPPAPRPLRDGELAIMVRAEHEQWRSGRGGDRHCSDDYRVGYLDALEYVHWILAGYRLDEDPTQPFEPVTSTDDAGPRA